MCWNSRVTIFCFNSITQWQLFLSLYSILCMSVPLWIASTWHLLTKFCKFEWNTFLNNVWMKNHIYLCLGKIVYNYINHLSCEIFWSNLLNGDVFYFGWTMVQSSKQILTFVSHLFQIQCCRYNLHLCFKLE